MNTTRRKFLKGAAGLASVVAAGPSFSLGSESDKQRIERLVSNSQPIKNEIFLLDSPVVISDIDELVMPSGTFYFTDRAAGKGPLITFDRCRLSIGSIFVESIGFTPDLAIRATNLVGFGYINFIGLNMEQGHNNRITMPSRSRP